jgi:hypothetical protein
MMLEMPQAIEQALPAHYTNEQVVKVRYRNYRGEVAIRTIVPIKVWWGSTEFHPHKQWILTVWDCEKNAERDYALQDIIEFIK